jgi:hypothetical protein
MFIEIILFTLFTQYFSLCASKSYCINKVLFIVFIIVYLERRTYSKSVITVLGFRLTMLT